MSTVERFGSRWGMMLAMLGMAVGTGNIWRFPRIAAANGGGEFLVAWITFLILWSIPLILVEFGFGRMTRAGPVAVFVRVLGPRWAWMGAFIAFVAVSIMFYYSVVAGWTIRYMVAAFTGQLPGELPGAFWTQFTESWAPVLMHAIAIGLGVYVVAKGVSAIERVAKILMPLLVILVVILAIRAITLPGAGAGLAYLFGLDVRELLRAELWLEGLTQNAWDTGAGWGLILCYAAYLREHEDTALNAFLLPIANNTISLLAGVMVICTVFSVVPELIAGLASNPEALAAYPSLAQAVQNGQPLTEDLLQRTIFSAGNEGLTFIWMPELFARLPLGRGFMMLFFTALSVAAFTSLMAMIELGTRVLRDAGLDRSMAIGVVGVTGLVLGFPSARSLVVLRNQDWVWGVALMVAGLFFSIAVIVHGVRRFREEQINHEHSNIRVGRWWDIVIGVLVPMQAVVLMVWWLYQAREWDPDWLNPLKESNVGTVLLQWAAALGLLILFNRVIARRTQRAADASTD